MEILMLIFVTLDLCLFGSSTVTATNNASIIVDGNGMTVDMLQALNISDEMRGVSEGPGLLVNVPAWRLHTAFDNVQLPSWVVSKLLSSWSVGDGHVGLSLHFAMRQHRKTIATLISINSPGRMSPWFRLTSHVKNGQQLVLFYHSVKDDKLHQTSFDMAHMQNWTQFLLSVVGNKVVLYVDCEPPIIHKLMGDMNLDFPSDSLIYFRQEPGFKKKFLGAVQVAKIMSYPVMKRPWNCDGEK